MTKFETAVNFVLDLEGGFVFNPQDHGKATKYGITSAMLFEFRKTLVAMEDVKALEKDEAIKIYAMFFWNAAKLERVKDEKTAIALFAFAVNAGPQTAIKLLQIVLKEKFLQKHITVDGILGNDTFEALSKFAPQAVNRELLRRMLVYYARICEKDASQLVFLEGWISRVLAIDDFITFGIWARSTLPL